jgi:fructokinase
MENPRLSQIDPLIQVATAGEALIDLIAGADGRFEPCLGGAVYNLARALARQGVPTLYLNPLSKDRFGRQLAAALAQDGVSLALPDPVQQVTSLAVVNLDDHGHADYAFYREGVADRAISAVTLTQACRQAESLSVVCTGALALSPGDAETYLPWLAAQRQAGRTVVIDANLRPSVMPNLELYRRHVLAALQFADVIKVSDEDLQCLALPGVSPLAQARLLLQGSRASVIAVTLGSQGAALLTRCGQVFTACEPVPVTVVDTVGAGDCFLSGWVVAMLQQRLPSDWGAAPVKIDQARALLSGAIASASLSVMRRGCVPPTLSEVQERMRTVPVTFQDQAAAQTR